MNVWKARPSCGTGIIHLSPNWKYALIIWFLPAIAAEFFIRLIGGSIIGIIAGIGASLIKSYYDFYIIMYHYHPFFKNKRINIKQRISQLLKFG